MNLGRSRALWAILYGAAMFIVGIFTAIGAQALERRWGWVSVQLSSLGVVIIALMVTRFVRRR